MMSFLSLSNGPCAGLTRILMLFLIATLASVLSARAADGCSGNGDPTLNLQKSVFFRQGPGGTLQMVRGLDEVADSYSFSLNFSGDDDSDVGDGLLQIPGGAGLFIDRGNWESAMFPSAAALDAAFPAGNYEVEMDVDGDTLTANLDLRNEWPDPVVVQNFSELQDVDPSQPLTLRLSSWGSSAFRRYTFLLVGRLNAPMTVGTNVFTVPFLPIYTYPGCGSQPLGAVTSVSIPARVLEPDASYDCYVARFAANSSSSRFGPYRTSITLMTQTRVALRTGHGAPGAIAPTIAWSSTPERANTGQPAVFGVTVTGSPTPALQWLKDGKAIPGASGTTFTIPSCTTGDAGTYQVRARNSAGTATTTSVRFDVVVRPTAPAIARQPGDAVVLAGKPASLSVAATGEPAPRFQWRKNGVPITNATNATLAWKATSANDAGEYDVLVSNGSGSVVSRAARLVVVVRPSIGTMAPRLLLQPLSTLSYPSVTLTAEVFGTGPLFFQWLKDGKTIAGATTREWTIAQPGLADAGNYSLIVSNAHGHVARVKKTRLLLAPIPELSAPIITKQPTAKLDGAGGLTLTVGVAKKGTLLFQWEHAPEAHGSNFSSVPGATNAVYRVSPAGAADWGSYRVRVSRRYVFPDRPVFRETVSEALTVTQPSVAGAAPGEIQSFQ